MSTSILVSIISSYFIVLFAGSVKLKYISAERTNVLTMNFGFDFFHKYSHLMGNKTIDLQSNCSMQLQIVKNAIKREELWALKFADAWAKLPAGILYGNNMDMGNFDECLSINEQLEAGSPIEGKYCLPILEIYAKRKENNLSFSSHFNFELGICIPSACEAFEIQLILSKYIETFWNISSYDSSLKITEDKCTSKNRGPLKALDWIAIGVLIVLGALLILSTVYEYLIQKQGKSSNDLLCAFSIHKNLSQLMRLTQNNETRNHIPALHGIRCLSLIWLILFHSYGMLMESPNMNNLEKDSFQQTPYSMVWNQGHYPVDTFFFFSSVLLTLVAFREMEKNSGKLNIPLLYLHRFIRLSPILYLCVLLSMTLFRFSVNGPIWNEVYNSKYKVCEDTWWATLLYIQNYVAVDKICLQHSWYLAVDTQLYFISPLILIIIWRWRRLGLAMLAFIGFLLVSFLFSKVILKDLIVFSIKAENIPGYTENYRSTHTRASPWIIGIIFGYYLHFHKNRRFVLSKLFVILGWIIAVSLFLTVVFALYPKTQPGATDITPLEGAFYLPLSHVAWSLGLCWIVFACVNGYGGLVNEFLSCVIWQPLSKLSYCIYIWHRLIVFMNGGQIKTSSYLSNYDLILRFWDDFGIALTVSTLMYLAVEAPILEIEKYCFIKNRTKKTRQSIATVLQQKLYS